MLNALRTRTRTPPALRQQYRARAWRPPGPKTVSFTSDAVLENTPHTPDTYQKDEGVSPPLSSKTHVVSESPDEDPRTQRPFEPPTGSYTSVDFARPYEVPANEPQEDKSKLGYGGTDRGGGGSEDVRGSGNPQDMEGKMGRQ